MNSLVPILPPDLPEPPPAPFRPGSRPPTLPTSPPPATVPDQAPKPAAPDLRDLIDHPPFHQPNRRPAQLTLRGLRKRPAAREPVRPDPAPLVTLAHARPTSIVIAGPDLAATCERIRALGGHLGAFGPVPRQNALWQLSIYWPVNQP